MSLQHMLMCNICTAHILSSAPQLQKFLPSNIALAVLSAKQYIRYDKIAQATSLMRVLNDTL
jgi:hypothetical protein